MGCSVLHRYSLAALLCTVACSGAAVDRVETASGPIEPATRDSAGVALHEHPGDAIDRAPIFTMDSAPLFVLGAGAADDFSRVFHVRLFADGRVVLYDDPTGAVKIFGTDGAPIASYGRKGEGPGEFQYVSAVVLLAGDTIAIHDPGSSRVTLMHPDTGAVRSFAVPPMGMFVSYALLTRGASGWFFAPTGYAVNGPPELATNGVRPQVAIVQVDEVAGVAGRTDTVGTTLGLELIRHRMEMMGQSREMSAAAHFSPQAMLSADAEGNLWVADNAGWDLRMLGDRGVVGARVRVNRAGRATTPAILDSLTAVQRRLISSSPQATPEMVEAFLAAERAKPMVDSLPPFAAVHATAGDLVWLSEYLAPGDLRAYFTAIDRRGRIVGRLALPAGSRAMAFGTDRVLLRTEDGDGVVRFAVHRLRAAQ